ncbi:hypothetical protein V6N13_006062 [Hibiscus sabdariffa]
MPNEWHTPLEVPGNRLPETGSRRKLLNVRGIRGTQSLWDRYLKYYNLTACILALKVANFKDYITATTGNTETLHLSSDDENDVFEWQSPRDHLQPAGPSQPTRAVPILSPAPTPANSAAADRPTPDSPARRKSKTPAGRIITRSEPSSSEEEAAHQPAQKRRRRHIITSDSDDDCSAAVPTSSADNSISFTF